VLAQNGGAIEDGNSQRDGRAGNLNISIDKLGVVFVLANVSRLTNNTLCVQQTVLLLLACLMLVLSSVVPYSTVPGT
jgi:hypothetical protein